MKENDKGKCEVQSCDNPAAWNKLCTACNAFFYYWKKRPLSRMMQHRGKAIRTQERTELLAPVEVVPLRKAKKAKR